LVAGWRAEEVEMARQDVELWKAEYDRAKAEHDRFTTLRPTNSISLTDFEAAKAAMLKSESQAKSMRSRFEMLVKGTRQEDIDEARAELAKMKADFDLIKRGAREEEIRGAKAQLAEVAARIRELDTLLRECTIVAPQTCRVEVVSVRRGDSASPNQPVLRVLYEDDMWIKAYVPETELGFIKLNQQVTIRHDGSTRDYQGTIFHIASVSEFTPRNVQSPEERHHQVFAVKVKIDNADGVFKSGMAARIQMPRKTSSEK
jgi:multidrug resistance efflux pump